MDESSMDEINGNVARGVALLDEHVPDWRERIDLDTLDLASTTDCIIGQVFTQPGGNDWGSAWTRGCAALGVGSDVPEQIAHGFERPGVIEGRISGASADAEYDALTIAWRQVLV